jgi:histidinol-phosphate aminotransferase
VTSLGMAGALAALEDENHVQRSIEMNNEGMAFWEKEFSRMGLDHWPSQGNFYLAKMPKDPKAIYENLLRQGVIVRPVAGYGLKEHLRISAGTKAENKRAVESLEKALREV